MFVLYGILAGLTLGMLRGGSLAGLARIRVRWFPAIVLAMAAQILLFGPLAGAIAPDSPVALAAFLGSTFLALAAAFLNRDLPGLPVLLLGSTLNALAILANDGVMPAAPSALASLGWSGDPAGYSNSAMIAEPALPWVTDIFALPSFVPFANVFSVGDVLIAVGAAWFVRVAMLRSPSEDAS